MPTWGAKRSLAHALVKAPHSLLVQSYQPREMTAGLLNADGFGVAGMIAAKMSPPFSIGKRYPCGMISISLSI